MAATRKITNRAFSVLLLAALVVCGMGVYLARYIAHGEQWALYFSRANAGSTGHIVDRNGITLAFFDETRSVYSPDRITRAANYHITGDYWGRTGTGILSRLWDDMHGFSLLTGTTHVASSAQLELTYDARLNNKIYEAIGEWASGCMLVCNYRTGEMLGMVSTPSVDPLDTSGEQRDGAFINRCISASFTPGSIFKLITAAAAIERIPDIEQRSWYCEEEYKIAGVPFHCVADHYTQNFEQALANSCNIAFAQIAVSLGQNTMIEYVRKYGFLDKHSLDGIPTAKGSYPLEFVGDPETGWSGIGQSTDLVVPYSMLRFLSLLHAALSLRRGKRRQSHRAALSAGRDAGHFRACQALHGRAPAAAHAQQRRQPLRSRHQLPRPSHLRQDRHGGARRGDPGQLLVCGLSGR